MCLYRPLILDVPRVDFGEATQVLCLKYCCQLQNPWNYLQECNIKLAFMQKNKFAITFFLYFIFMLLQCLSVIIRLLLKLLPIWLLCCWSIRLFINLHASSDCALQTSTKSKCLSHNVSIITVSSEQVHCSRFYLFTRHKVMHCLQILAHHQLTALSSSQLNHFKQVEAE